MKRIFFSIDGGRLFFCVHVKRIFFIVSKEGDLLFLEIFPCNNVFPFLDVGASVIAPPKGMGYSRINPVLTPITGHAPYGR